MFVESRPFNHVSLESIVDSRNQLEGQCLNRSLKSASSLFEGKENKTRRHTNLEDGRRRYAVAEKIVELCADDQDLRGRMLNHNIIRHLRDERFPVRWCYWRLIRNRLTTYIHLISAKAPPRVIGMKGTRGQDHVYF